MSQQPEALIRRMDAYLRGESAEATAIIKDARAQVERLQAAHIDVPEGWRLVMVEAGTAPDEPDWDEVRRQAEVTTGLKVERTTPAQEAADTGADGALISEGTKADAATATHGPTALIDEFKAAYAAWNDSPMQNDIRERYRNAHATLFAALAARSGQVAAPAMVPLPTEYIKRVREGSPGRRFLHFGLPELIEVTRAIEAASAKLNGLTVGGSKGSGGASCQSCGAIATRHVSDEATSFPGPYCNDCGPGLDKDKP